MKKVFIKLIEFYQKHISPLKKPCCRFVPTCSQYSKEAIGEWGIIRGTGLTLWRIIRCNPFCKGGYDPVPENKRKRAKLQIVSSEKEKKE